MLDDNTGPNTTVSGLMATDRTSALYGGGLSISASIGLFFVAYVVYHNLVQLIRLKRSSLLPLVYHCFPILGSALDFGRNPYAFLQKNRRKYGDVFSFVVLNKRVTFAVGPAGSNIVFHAKSSEASPAEVYRVFTRPVFGEGVIYDTSHEKLMEQKSFIKSVFTTDAWRRFVPVIASVTKFKLDAVLQQDQSSRVDAVDFGSSISRSASCATLQGKEVCAAFDDRISGPAGDIMDALPNLSSTFPSVPTPSNRRRARAQKALSAYYLEIIRARRAAMAPDEPESDLLSILLGSTYKNGDPLPDRHVAHLMIALLISSSFNSSVALAWCILCLADRPDLVEKLRREQEDVYGRNDDDGNLEPLDYDKSLQTPLLGAFVKEVMRLHPPLHFILRKVMSPILVPSSLAASNEHAACVIPPGDLLVTTSIISHADPTIWRNADSFDPYRWLEGGDQPASGSYTPYGGGPHRCVAEGFAQVLMMSVVGTLVRECDLELVHPFPPHDYQQLVLFPKGPRDVIIKCRA